MTHLPKSASPSEPRPTKMVGCEALRNGSEHFGIHDYNNFCEQRGCVAEPRRDEREMFDDFLKDAPIDLAHRISIMRHSYAFQFWQAARASAAPLNQEDEDRSKVAGRAKLLMKFYVAMHEAGIKSNWEAQERISIDELAELMSKEEPRK